MAIRKVARMGHPVLRQSCRELSAEEIVSPDMRRLVLDMLETMDEYGGVGLAAPQVHEPIRLCVIGYSDDNPRYEVEEPQQPLIIFNARVTVLDEVREGYWEGCLSVPDMRGYVERPRKVQIDYLDQFAESRQIVAEGFLATVFQHELDHLDGVLYVDRLTDPRLFAFNEEYGRYLAGASDDDDEDEGEQEAAG